MSDEKPPKKSAPGDWKMPEPTFRVSEGRVINKDESEIITEEHEITGSDLPTEEPAPPAASTAESDARGYGQDDDGRPVFGSGNPKRGCLALKLFIIALVIAVLVFVVFIGYGIYYFFFSRPESGAF